MKHSYFKIVTIMYILEHAIKGVGTYPQSIDARLTASVEDERYISTTQPGSPIPDDVLVPMPVLEKKAKLTDLISVVFMGMEHRLLVSAKLQEILTINSFGIQFVPTKLITKTDALDYYIVHAEDFATPDKGYSFFAIPNHNGAAPGFVVNGSTVRMINDLTDSGVQLQEL